MHVDRYDGDRCQYRYEISATGGETLATGSDLRSGSGADIDLVDTLRSLLSFLGAFLESGETGENSDLFPPACRAIDGDYVSGLTFYLGSES